MAKKTVSLVGAGVAALTLLSAAPSQAAVDLSTTQNPDAFVRAESQTPIPGGMTVGRVNIGNNAGAQAYLPAGTTFTVKFERLQGVKKTGTTTLTTWHSSTVGISRVDDDTFTVVLKRNLAPGEIVSLDWSKAHWFDYSTRDKITISLNTLPTGVVDADSSNNSATYDNVGRGF